jgi:hypothetical protein
MAVISRTSAPTLKMKPTRSAISYPRIAAENIRMEMRAAAPCDIECGFQITPPPVATQSSSIALIGMV